MDRLQNMALFVAAADLGGFAKAGARLKVSPPAVTRAIAGLEGRLGARLFNRTTRRLKLTEAGARFLDSSRRLLADLETAEKDAVGEAAAPHGLLTITASVTFGRDVLAPILLRFLARHPNIDGSLVLLDRVAHLIEEGIDVGVRIGQLPDSGLIGKRVGTVQRLLVASPAYLKARGVPKDPAELKAHDIIAFTGLMPGHEIRVDRDGKSRAVAVRPRLAVNDAAAAIAAAEAGHGVTVALSYMVAAGIRARRLVVVLPKFNPPPAPVHLIYAQSRLVPAKVRAFIDFAAPLLERALAPLRV